MVTLSVCVLMSENQSNLTAITSLTVTINVDNKYALSFP